LVLLLMPCYAFSSVSILDFAASSSSFNSFIIGATYSGFTGHTTVSMDI
jgi:hypothetical protein